VRVVAIEDHRLVYDALEAVVRLIEPDCDLSFVATLGEAFDLLADDSAVDLVLMDLGLPDSRGLATLEKFRQRFAEMPVVVVSGIDEHDVGFQEVVLHAINDHRAMGFIPKSHDKDRGIMALRHVLAGNIYLPREAAHGVGHGANRDALPPSGPIVVHPVEASDSLRRYGFTEAQARVARLLLEGLSNKEIARKLSITDHTVKAHASAIFDALNVKTRLQAVVRLESLLREKQIRTS
jgi:DNA-binding NarL/FixJ family response regulator